MFILELHVLPAGRGGKRTREGAESGMGRLERMNHGIGIKECNL